MKPIIAAVDFTDRARNAAYYAADIALATEADLHLFHAVQLPLTPAPVGFIFEQAVTAAGASLKSLADELQQRTKHQLSVTTVLEIGGLASRLGDVCDRLQPFLVVMGGPRDSRERPAADDGSLYTVRHLPWPVLAVPPGAIFHAIKKVAIACEMRQLHDSTPVSRNFLEQLQQLFACQFAILNVRTENGTEQDKAVFELYHWQASLEDLTPAMHFLKAETVVEGITRYLKDQEADWLMVFPRRHGVLEFHRSQSKRLILHCPVPVLSISEPQTIE